MHAEIEAPTQGKSAMSNITATIYGGGSFYSGGQTVVDDLKSSGFTTVIAWAVHVEANGDLVYNDPPPIVGNGKYIGDSKWPGCLANLKQGGSVNRLLFSIGGWGVRDFSNIHQLGTGPDSILYRNFKALKDAIPAIDGIDLDDEESPYNKETIVGFSQMLHTLGCQVTFCPYNNQDFWINCLYALNSKTPDLVTGFNLQCYAGGAGNDPQVWINAIKQKMGPRFPAAAFVYPGLACRSKDQDKRCMQGDCPDDITSKLKRWKSTGIQGGFIWLYDDIQKCSDSGSCPGRMDTAAYAGAILKALQEA